MNLWIRSQDKILLTKVDCLEINKTFKDIDKVNGIEGYAIFNGIDELGFFKTKERALEVLDEIQEILMMCIKANGNEHLVGTSCYVYQMPQE